MKTALISALLTASLLTGCDSHSGPASVDQFEQAKADCESHGGLASVEMVYGLFGSHRADAVCRNKVRISRDAR